ncbi:MAG TPA: hypothetical protein DCW29_23750, partial [Janthinobacterium sp.]|nr:hypothetical protein [Janthinobacterium sp.]
MTAPFEARRRSEKNASGRPFGRHALLAVATLGCLLAPPLAAGAADPSSAQAAHPKAAAPTGAGPAPGVAAALDAAQAISAYLGRQSRGAEKNLSEAERRLRAANIVDAVWHLATRPMADEEAGAAPTAHEADYLNAVAQTAAAYANLGGAAAYAAWYTYRHTGNADLAMRVGVQSAAASRAFPVNGETLLDAAGGRARQAAVAGAVGGLAVAAAGGDQRAIDEAFLLDGGMLLVQDGYKRYIGSVLAARATEEDAYCLAAMGADCPGAGADAVYVRDEKGAIVYRDGKPRPDPARRARNRDAGARSGKWDGERSAFKHSEATLAGLNALTLFRSQWAISWDMAGLKAPGRLAPAIVITYAGSGAPYYEMLRVSAQGVDEKRKIRGVRVM